MGRVTRLAQKNAVTEKRKRRWYQFSLRTLLIAVLLLSLAFGWLAARMERARGRETVDAIRRLGGSVYFDYQWDEDEQKWRFDGVRPPSGWKARLLGEDVGSKVRVVRLGPPTEVSDGDLRLLAGLTRLEFLQLCHTSITDEGLAHLEGLASLRLLDLGCTSTSDAGLKHIRRLAALRELRLTGTRVTGAGLVELKGLTRLEELWLGDLDVSDGELAHLEALTSLQRLDLAGTPVTDAGLIHLGRLANLVYVDLRNTQFSPEGVKKLQTVFPQCEIVY